MTSSGPDLTAVIAELAGRLPPGHVAAWARVLRSVTQQEAVTHSKLIEARLIEAKSGTLRVIFPPVTVKHSATGASLTVAVCG